MSALNQKIQQDDKKLNTEIKPEHKDLLKLMIAEIRKDPNSFAFHEPVPWQAMGLWNYPQIIKKPMDLTTIKTNVMHDYYKTFDACFAEIQLIWTNCKLYNQQGSPIYIQAEKLERKSKKLIQKLKNKVTNGGSSKQGNRSKQQNTKDQGPIQRSESQRYNRNYSPTKQVSIVTDPSILGKRKHSEVQSATPPTVEANIAPQVVVPQSSAEKIKVQKKEQTGPIPTSIMQYNWQDDYQGVSASEDQEEIIEDQIHRKISLIKDVKQLNQIQQMSDEQILNLDVEELTAGGETTVNLPTVATSEHQEPLEQTGPAEDPTKPTVEKAEDAESSGSGEDDDDDDFECDIERYVPFDEKIEFAEKMKQCSKEGLSKVVAIIQEIQPQALDDYGNSRVQLKIDLIDREAFDKCNEILLAHLKIEKRLRPDGSQKNDDASPMNNNDLEPKKLGSQQETEQVQEAITPLQENVFKLDEQMSEDRELLPEDSDDDDENDIISVNPQITTTLDFQNQLQVQQSLQNDDQEEQPVMLGQARHQE